MEAPLYNQKGDKKGTVNLPENLFNLAWNDSLVHQVIVSQLSNKRNATAHTKIRSEVSGGGKKPWKQKGLGRARVGSTRSPIWTGGGVTFGPRSEKDYSKKINVRMKNKSILTILSQKVRDDAVVFVDKLSFEKPDTKEANLFVKKVRKSQNKENGKLILVLDKNIYETRKSFSNLPKVDITSIETMNPSILLDSAMIMFVNPDVVLTAVETKNI